MEEGFFFEHKIVGGVDVWIYDREEVIDITGTTKEVKDAHGIYFYKGEEFSAIFTYDADKIVTEDEIKKELTKIIDENKKIKQTP